MRAMRVNARSIAPRRGSGKRFHRLNAPASAEAITGLHTSAPAITIASPNEGQAFVEGARPRAAYSCAGASGAGIASCTGPVPNHSSIDTDKVGQHTFSVTAVDTFGNRTTKSVRYTVLSRGTLTITGPVKAFRRGGKWWIDTGMRAACPNTGPACTGFLNSHRADSPLGAARIGHTDLNVAGGKSVEITFELGPRRSKALDKGETIHLWLDAWLSRGTSRFAHIRRVVPVTT